MSPKSVPDNSVVNVDSSLPFTIKGKDPSPGKRERKRKRGNTFSVSFELITRKKAFNEFMKGQVRMIQKGAEPSADVGDLHF